MHQVLVEIGGFKLQTYSLLMAIAALFGFAVALHEGNRRGMRSLDIADAALWAAIGGILGARLEYVLVNPEYFGEQPGGALQIWQGGFAYHGGLLGGVLVLILWTRLKRVPFWEVADALSLGFCLSVVIGWAACLFGGCVYGRMGFGPLYFTWYDIFGVTASRFAVQPLGIALTLVLFGVLFLFRDRMPFPGATFVSFVLVSGLFHFGLSFGRGDETLVWNGLRVEQWLAAVQVASAATIGWVCWLEAVRRPAV